MTSLYQDKIWTTIEGETLRLEDMTPTHRANLIAFLERNAKRFKFRSDMEFILNFPPDDCFDDCFDEDPLEWVHSTPLMRRLVELNADRSVLAPKVDAIRNKIYRVKRLIR